MMKRNHDRSIRAGMRETYPRPFIFAISQCTYTKQKEKGEAEAPPHNPLGIRQAQYLTALGWCKDSNNIATSSYLVVL